MADTTIPDGYSAEEWNELQKLNNAVMGLREQNARKFQQVQALGADINLAPARIQHFLEFLVNIGLVNEMQALQEMKDWELVFREQLDLIRAQATEMRRAQGAAVQAESGLIIPGKNQQV